MEATLGEELMDNPKIRGRLREATFHMVAVRFQVGIVPRIVLLYSILVSRLVLIIRLLLVTIRVLAILLDTLFQLRCLDIGSGDRMVAATCWLRF